MSETDEVVQPAPQAPDAAPKSRGGRPTKEAAALRDERLLEIATQMFMENGFEATSMESLAEAAAIGKATLYARYADKSALFGAVLRRRILQVYLPIETESIGLLKSSDLETSLLLVARRLLERTLAPEAITLGRILSAQSVRFPELVQFAMKEGWERQLQLVENVLQHFAQEKGFALQDIPLAADLFLSIILGRATRLAMHGILPDPDALMKRGDMAVKLFVRGLAILTH